jgi:hypothetical protein
MDNDRVERRTDSLRPWRAGCALLAAVLLVAALASCALGRVSIQHGLIRPPLIRQHVGPFYLIARATRTPECLAVQCGGSFVIERAGAQRSFVVWVVFVQRDAAGFHVHSFQLARVPLDERP